MNLNLKDYKKIRTPFVFLDETGNLNDKVNRFFCLGIVKCMQPFFLDSRIRSIREKNNFYDEIKWNTISKAKVGVLEEIVKAIFETPGIYFSCIFINKDDVDFKKAFDSNLYLAYQKFTEILLQKSIEENEVLTILADYIATPKKIAFEVDVKHSLNTHFNRLAIAGVHRVDSKGVNLIQVTDLLIGAVSYCYKKDLNLVSGDKNKIKILNIILTNLKIKNFIGGVNSKRFKVMEYKAEA